MVIHWLMLFLSNNINSLFKKPPFHPHALLSTIVFYVLLVSSDEYRRNRMHTHTITFNKAWILNSYYPTGSTAGGVLYTHLSSSHTVLVYTHNQYDPAIQRNGSNYIATHKVDIRNEWLLYQTHYKLFVEYTVLHYMIKR